ncbi:HEPN domain-containing protein [Stutzerimonas nitrititolerans]|uniref:HEPN domain-containing protein n=1 Tax=Stutzerimonas nitrititolerans TaxID=2482751 RepID=UPI0028AD6644|nr:HEPN domain-containing protein [Stutzerimonas nitrititolerans]
MEMQEDEKSNWIREQLGDELADEDTEGWDELSIQYDYMRESLQESADVEAEFQWYKQHSYSQMHETFNNNINDLKDLLSIDISFQHENIYYKMVFAHAVTLLESFLADTVKSLVVSNDEYLQNAIKNVDELKNKKFGLADLNQKEGVVGLVLKELSDILYHNIPKVVRVLTGILNCSINVDQKEVCRITSVRHDIVHRNGKTVEGDIIDLDFEAVFQAINDVEKFVLALQLKISETSNR